MTERLPIPMSRARLYVLLDAFERDIRTILARYVLSDLGEQAALASTYDKALHRRTADEAATDATALTEYLDLREAYDLLNTHRGLIPQDLGREVRELTPNLDRVVAIRNRVMHPRPLLAGDSDAAVSLLNQFSTPFWRELQRIMAQLDADPSWEPLVGIDEDPSSTLHNLPLPDYDETGLIGRARAVSDLVALIRRGREPVITVTGEGGIGKTAVALEVAYRLLDDNDEPFDAVLWTSLKHEKLSAAGIRTIADATRDLVGAAQPLGAALDATFSGTVRDLAEALADLHVLVVIDNLETLGGADFELLYTTLPDTVFYLVTSRVEIGEYERRYPLEPLSPNDGLRLFNDFVRARRVEGLRQISSEARVNVVTRLRFSPLGIRWFILAVESGRDPVRLIRGQEELLEFCVRSVYESLGPAARDVLAALAALSRPMSSDELVVLLDTSTDRINVGLQELIRGSLVRRESGSPSGDPVLNVRLTETAAQFLSRRVILDEDLKRRIITREREYRALEERRAADAAARSLAPIVVRTRTVADSPTAQILRRALLSSKNENYSKAFEDIDRARRLHPDYWEVDRVEGFVRAAAGEHVSASRCYERAYTLTVGDDKAVVAHFFAGHLARNIRDVKTAASHARKAYSILQSPETAVALGTYLVWLRDFEAGIRLLEPAVKESSGKGRLIALSSLSDGYRRWAEFSRDEERNPLAQYRRASRGLSIALASLEVGVSDQRLRAIAADCAATALQAADTCLQAGEPISGLGPWLDRLSTVLIRFSGTRRWPALIQSARRMCAHTGCPTAGRRLLARIEELNESAEPSETFTDGRVFSGEVVTVKDGYGFIRHPAFPENLFFPRSGLTHDNAFDDLRSGALVSFTVDETGRGPRAACVTVQESS